MKACAGDFLSWGERIKGEGEHQNQYPESGPVVGLRTRPPCKNTFNAKTQRRNGATKNNSLRKPGNHEIFSLIPGFLVLGLRVLADTGKERHGEIKQL
jgi:hypothetical protein